MLLLIISILAQSACSQPKGDITLVSGGKASHVIVIPAEPGKAEIRAANVLQDYVKRMSGATLRILRENAYTEGQAGIFIGHTGHVERFNTGKPKADGFMIATDAQHLYILGGSGKGVIYGVYTLLENYFGCRKYANIPTYTPASKTLRVPQQLMDRQEPQFIYRETFYPASLDAEYQEWHKLHSFESLWGLWGHSFFKLVPPKTWFATHPEYYALVNGKRQASQLCLSNESVYRITTDYFRKAIADNPDAIYWSIAPEDGSGFCTCDACSKAAAEDGGPQGPLLRFVNKVAAQFKDQRFTTLAYTYTAKPTRKTKPASNVYIMLSSIDAFRDQPLAASAFKKDLEGWKAITNRLFIWDYTTQFTNYVAPFPDYDQLSPNLRYFSDNGVQGVFSQGSGYTWGDMAELNAYLQAKLLWQPQRNADSVITDFTSGYYGKAGPAIAAYLKAITNAVKTTNARLDIYGSPVKSHADYLSPTYIEQYGQLLDNAEKAAEGNTIIQERIAIARLPLEYTVLQQARFYGPEPHGYIQPEDHQVNPKWPERVKRFVALAKKTGVTEMSEGGGDPDAYAQEWETVFARPWLNSLAYGAKTTLVHPFSEDFPAKKERTLTDGLTGTKDFSLNWLFIYGNDLVATIDMGEVKSIRNIQMNFLQDARHNIFLPVTITVETSEDGSNFQPAGQQSPKPVEEENFAAYIETFKLAATAKARYVRVSAQCLPVMPAWRGSEKKPAICCDEVFIF